MAEAIVYLGLGSNMEDRKRNLEIAIGMLRERFRIGAVSSIYETDPVGDVNQPKFLNMTCQAFTTLQPDILLALVKGIEFKLGRPQGIGGPRPIDIDILLYGNMVMDTPNLIIPHPRMAERAFVLVPLAEIAPAAVHPVKKQTIKELLDGLKEKQGVVKYG